MSLYKLAILMEEVPGCGTRFPGYQAPGDGDSAHAGRTSSAHAEPPDHRQRALVAAALDSVRLFQLGIAVGGELHLILASSAERLYRHSRCSEVSAQSLFEMIQRHWPVPPPSPPMRLIEALAAAHMAHSRFQLSPAIEQLIARMLCLYGPCPEPADPVVMGPEPSTKEGQRV